MRIMFIDQTRRSVTRLTAVALLAGIAALMPAQPVFAQDDAQDTPPAHGFDEKFLETMEWRCIGPPRGGRATACTGVIGDPMIYYMGVTGGGVWKTANAGLTWEPIGDEHLTTGSVGAIAVSQVNPNRARPNEEQREDESKASEERPGAARRRGPEIICRQAEQGHAEENRESEEMPA